MVTITRGRACSSVHAISRGVENVLMATSGAPTLAAANAVISHSGRFGSSTATRSPRDTPSREQRAGDVVDARAQRRVGQALAAEDDGLGVGPGRAPCRRGERPACARAGPWLSAR